MKELNADANVHGILVQVPLPEHMNEYEVLDVIAREKDVDGFHPLNIGMLFHLKMLLSSVGGTLHAIVGGG